MSAKWSEAENDWLRRRYGREHMPRLLAEFEREFGRATTAGAVFQKAHKMGLTNNAAKAPQRAVRAVHWRSEPEMQAWMLEHDDGQAIPELSAQFAEEFGFPLSRPQISLWRASNGRNTRISHGGRRPLPVGAERYDEGKGYVLVKVAESPTVPQSKDNWRLKHVVEYERAHGPVPDGCNVVMANRNPRDFSPGNLIAAMALECDEAALPPRRCLVDGERCLFHLVYVKHWTHGASSLIGGFPAGQESRLFALVEGSDGTMREVPATRVRLLDSEMLFGGCRWGDALASGRKSSDDERTGRGGPRI